MKLSVNEKFTKFGDYIREHGKHYFGEDQGYQNNTKEWFTLYIKDIVDKKANAYVQWQLHRGMKEENDYRNKYRTLAKLVKNKVEAGNESIGKN